MSKAVAVVSVNQVDEIADQIIETHRLMHEAEAAAAEHERKATDSRDAASMRRFEIGKLLIRARAAWPERGPKAKGWGEFLSRVQIDQVTAWRYMQIAGATEISFSSGGDVKETPPRTYAEAGIDNRPRSEEQPKANRDSWCTPKWLADALPAVDTDPCSNPRSHIRAVGSYSLEKGEDGLVLPWVGLVYVNGPYSNLLPWAERLALVYPAIKGAGFLVNADHSPAWWKVLTRVLWLRLDFDDRLEFDPPPGVEPSKNDRPQSLLMDHAFWRSCDQVSLLKRGTLWEMRNHGDR
jgi:hypothetical protein